jgi:biopolymer transport protein ExbD
MRLQHLRRRYMAQAPRVRGLLQVAPWVNVTLLVLLFTIVNSAYVMQPGVVVDLPSSVTTGGARFGSLIVTVASDGLLFYDDERITLDGLAAVLARDAQKDPERTLVIEADGQVAHRTMVAIYDHAVAAGLRRVVLATRAAETER